MESNERMVEEGAVDVSEACRFTGVGRSFLYSLMEAGRLPYVKLGKRRLIPRAELRRLLAESLAATPDRQVAVPVSNPSHPGRRRSAEPRAQQRRGT